MWKRVSILAIIGALCAMFAVQASAREIKICGHLEPTVEAGGWLIVVEEGETVTKYLLLNQRDFRGLSWFRAGAKVKVTGEVRADAVTIYQEGIPFEARTIQPSDMKK